jgi:hypothetical protein
MQEKISLRGHFFVRRGKRGRIASVDKPWSGGGTWRRKARQIDTR